MRFARIIGGASLAVTISACSFLTDTSGLTGSSAIAGDASVGSDGSAPLSDAASDTAASDSAAIGSPGAPSDVTAAAVPLDYAVSTPAGSGASAPFADGLGAAATFNSPFGVAVDTSGNAYVADLSNQRIRKMSPTGVVTTLAGSGLTVPFMEGAGATATFDGPCGVAVDSAGTVYVGEQGENRIRKVTAAGVVSTLAGSGVAAFADGTGAAASFNEPCGVAVDSAGTVFVADQANHRIRRVSAAGAVTTIAGSGTATFADGTGAAASFNYPAGVAVDASGNVFVGDAANYRIRMVSPTQVVTTLAGSGTSAFADGTGAAASFGGPFGVAVDAARNVYVADSTGQRIRKISPTGVVTTLAGSGLASFADGTGTASFNRPNGIAVSADASLLYVADALNNRIRKLTAVGIGELNVRWKAASVAGTSPITGYTATAIAAGNPTQTCTTTGTLFCTIAALKTGVPYDVSVTATNDAGTGVPSAPATAAPN